MLCSVGLIDVRPRESSRGSVEGLWPWYSAMVMTHRLPVDSPARASVESGGKLVVAWVDLAREDRWRSFGVSALAGFFCFAVGIAAMNLSTDESMVCGVVAFLAVAGFRIVSLFCRGLAVRFARWFAASVFNGVPSAGGVGFAGDSCVAFRFVAVFPSFFFVLLASCCCGISGGSSREGGGWLLLSTAAIDLKSGFVMVNFVELVTLFR